MESKNLSKKGRAIQAPDGNKALVNEKGDSFAVDEAVIAVWGTYQNKTVEEVVEEIASHSGRNPNEVREPLEQLTAKLKDAELLA